MRELHRKYYRLEIQVRRLPFTMRWAKTLTFEYHEGTMRDVLEIANTIESGEQLYKWLHEFLNSHGGITTRQYVTLSQQMLDETITYVLRTYGGGYFKLDGAGEEDKTPTTNAPESASICTLLRKSNETVETLLSMTWAQFSFLVDGIVYNENEKTKEGQIRNLQKVKGGGDDQAARDRIADFEKLLSK